MLARLLKVPSDLGVQLDSLADMVTSGVVPGIVMFQLLRRSTGDWTNIGILDGASFETSRAMNWFGLKFQVIDLIPFIGLTLTLAAAYRLAKFNIDTRQTTAFIGLPTPAMALYVISLPLILAYGGQDLAIELISNPYFLLFSTLALSILMNVEVQLFALKFKDFSFNKNLVEIIFLVLSFLLFLMLKFVAIPIVIVLYLLFSLFKADKQI